MNMNGMYARTHSTFMRIQESGFVAAPDHHRDDALISNKSIKAASAFSVLKMLTPDQSMPRPLWIPSP